MVGASSWKEGSIVSQNDGSSAHAMPPPRPSNERASAGRPQRYENGEGTQAGAARRRSAIAVAQFSLTKFLAQNEDKFGAHHAA